MLKRVLGSLTILAVALLPAAVAAQSATTGAIAGTARDTSGAVMPGVTVEAASPALIEKVRVAVTDGQGNYKIIDLRPGTYSVTFSLPGFATYRREGIEVTTGVTIPANAEMKVGALNEMVTVTGASPVVDVQNVRSQMVLSSEVLTALPVSKSIAGTVTLTLGASSVGTGNFVQMDVGGSRGDANGSVAAHGMRSSDQRELWDGMPIASTQGNGTVRIWQPNPLAVQELVVATGAASAEVETGGVQMNRVPKEGANSFTFQFIGAYTNEDLNSKKLTDEIVSRGITNPAALTAVKRVYEAGAVLGGPVKRDKLWFFAASRSWSGQEYQANTFYNASTNPFAYVPDRSRRGFYDARARDFGGRLTWQATAKNKIAFGNHVQTTCYCNFALSAITTPEAAPQSHSKNMQLPQLAWSYPASNRVLLDAGASWLRGNNHVRSEVNGIRLTEATTGLTWGGNATGCCGAGNGLLLFSNYAYRASASYVAGSHAVKVGTHVLDQTFFQNNDVANGEQVSYTLLNGRPNAILQWATPIAATARGLGLGLFAQDQWTINRLTLNVGVRFDRFHGWVPAGTTPGGRFYPSFSFDKVDDVPNFSDINPRLGAAFDVFGTGKTAIKVSYGRYVSGLALGVAQANDPALALVLNASRTWNDANANFVPDCNLASFAANGECAALTNARFGQPFRNTFFDSSATSGWGQREYSTQASLTLQHELRPGFGFTAGYFRTQYGNHTVTQNSLVTAADFDPYCVTAPADPRLPGGGGNQICGFYDVTRARFGQVRNVVTEGTVFGKQTEKYDGVDLAMNARFGSGGLVQGGVSFGRQVTDNCYQNSRPDLTAQGFAAGTARTAGFCDVTPPWSAGTQVKFSGIYPLPWGFESGFVLQNLPGVPLLANWSAPNAVIAPSLGRNLAACPAAGACTSTATVSLIPPGTQFLKRITQLDLRLTKIVRIGRLRAKGVVELFNATNDRTMLNVNNTFGPAWQRPLIVHVGRLLKFGTQLDF